MSKKPFGIPAILLGLPDESENPENPIGGGSAHGSTPISWTVWQTIYTDKNHYDYDHDGDIDEYDYYHWWTLNGYNKSQWQEANPGLNWPGDSNNP